MYVGLLLCSSVVFSVSVSMSVHTVLITVALYVIAFKSREHQVSRFVLLGWFGDGLSWSSLVGVLPGIPKAVGSIPNVTGNHGPGFAGCGSWTRMAIPP